MEKRNWWPYIKPTKKRHDGSGYRCFEVGYISQGEKRIIHSGADHIYWISMLNKPPLMINIDLLDGGEIQFFSKSEGLRWSDLFGFSSMQLEAGYKFLI